MNPVAVRFVHVSDQVLFVTVNDALVEYRPDKKYRIEKKNAFDPSYIHRRGAYYEDTITISAILSPDLYETLKNTLMAAGWLYVEFAYKGGTVRQLPVVVSAFPVLTDDLREYTAETKITLISRYRTKPGVINWDGYRIPDGDEVIV